jgi:hypothetical protein
VLYVPNNAMKGRYTFRVLVMYLGVGSWTEAYFDVVSRNGGPGGGHGEATTTTETAVTTTMPQQTSLEFYSVPLEVYSFQGETKPVMVIIENTGNVTVPDVNLELTSSLEVGSILPEDVTINPGERKVFIIEVWVDENAAEGEYPSVVTIMSSKVENQAEIRFIISEKPSDYRKQLSQRIDDLTQITDDIWKEAVRVRTSENTDNITEVFNLLQMSKNKIVEAKEYMSYVRYNETEKSLDMAVQFIELGVVELSKIKSPQNQSITTQTVVQTKDLNWVIVIAFFLLVALFLLLLRRNSKLNKQVHEFYDLGRIKGLIFGKDAKDDNMGSLSDPGKGKLN